MKERVSPVSDDYIKVCVHIGPHIGVIAEGLKRKSAKFKYACCVAAVKCRRAGNCIRTCYGYANVYSHCLTRGISTVFIIDSDITPCEETSTVAVSNVAACAERKHGATMVRMGSVCP